jgi:hypothetical protein
MPLSPETQKRLLIETGFSTVEVIRPGRRKCVRGPGMTAIPGSEEV